MEKRRVLFICPQPLWPTDTGARLRNFHLAHALTASCDVTILQLTDPKGNAPPAGTHAFQKVISVKRDRSYTPGKVLRGLAGPLPVTVLNYTSSQVARVLRSTLMETRFNAVVLESIHLYDCLNVIQSLPHPPCVLLDWHNIESELMQRYAVSSGNPLKKAIALRTSHLLNKLEKTALRAFSAHTVVSEREKEKLLLRAPDARVHLIPNGVATAHFTPAPATGKTLLFVGSMDYHANVEAVIWFCREVWPQLSAQNPAIEFKIVGRNPPESVKNLARDGISVSGSVPDVRPFYQQAFAVVTPLLIGGGTRLKILEAMAAGVPVVSTRLGAEGLAVENGQQLLLADTPTDIAAGIHALFTQPDLSLRLRQAARQLVIDQYDWAAVGRRLELAILSSC